MKFWFRKKENADETSATKNDVQQEVKPDLTSIESGEGAASIKPDAGKSVPDDEAKSVESNESSDDKADAGVTDTSQTAPPSPVLRAVVPTNSGAQRIRPIISLKTKAQGAGLAALAAAERQAPAKKIDAVMNASGKVPETGLKSGDDSGDKTGTDDIQKAEAKLPEKGRAVLESEGIPVRPKPDQRALYYQLMNGLYDAILILDDKGYVVDCNTRFTDILGYAREDSWDMPIDKIIAGMTSQMLGHLKRNLLENHHIILDARCFRKDGTSFTAEVGVSVFSLTHGDNLIFMIRNVERRKKAMDELRKSHIAFETALAPAFVSDTDGCFVLVNQAFLEIFSIPDAEHAKAIRFVDLLPDGSRIFLRAACGEKIRDKIQIVLPDNTHLTLDIALVPVQNGQAVTGVAGSIMQI